MAAYFKMINDQGGINGRKISFISYDDGYSPPKTVEMTRKLVERTRFFSPPAPARDPNQQRGLALHEPEEGAAIVRRYRRHKMGRPEGPPLDDGLFRQLPAEGRIYAAYILKNKPDAKIGVLYQNDDFGKDYLNGLVEGLGAKAASMIKIKASYETTDPTVDLQIVQMKRRAATYPVTIAIPKFGAQAIRKVAEIEWKPLHILNGIASSVGAALKPAGLENSKGIITDNSFKDPPIPSGQTTPATKSGSVHGQVPARGRQER